jgi:outer membrane receptor protein involved in Fe transport
MKFPGSVWLCVVAVLSINSPLLALEGRLRLDDGSPAAGYEVSVSGRPAAGSVRTDREGSFRLTPDPVAPFALVVTGPGGAVFAPIEVREAPAGELQATLAAAYSESVTVASGVAATIEAPAAAATVTLTRADIEARRPQHVADSLQGVAGASRTAEGPDAVPILRGLTAGRTLILLDGARVTAERRAGPSAGYVDPLGLATIEVARGPGSVAYGSDALGGVISLRSPDPETGRWRLGYDAAAWGGGIEELGGGVALSGGIGAHGALLVQARAREAQDQEAADGEPIPNSSYRDRSGALRWLQSSSFGEWRVGFSAAEVRDMGKPAADVALTRSSYPEESSRRFNVNWLSERHGSWEPLEASVFLGSYRLITDRERQPIPGVTRRLERTDLDADDASLRGVAARVLGGGRLSFGLESAARLDLAADNLRVNYNDADLETSRSSEVAIESADRVDHGVFANWDGPIGGRLALSAGIRADQVRSENQGGFFGDQSVNDDAVSGNLALTAGPFRDATVTLQYARGFRSPFLSDRYFRGTSGRGFIIGNPDLEPETSDQLDGAFRWVRRGTSLALHGYLYRIEDLIERYRPPGSDDFHFHNRGEAEVSGVELEGQIDLSRALRLPLRLEVALASARGEDRSTGDALDSIAPFGGWTTVRWMGTDASAYLRWAAFANDDRPGPTETVRPGQSVLDLGASYRFSEHLELRLGGRNILDRRYRESADANAALAPGRSWLLGFAGRL